MNSSKICLSICLFVLSQCFNLVDSIDHDHTRHSNRLFDSRGGNSTGFYTGYPEYNRDYTPYGYDYTSFNPYKPENRTRYTSYGPYPPQSGTNYTPFWNNYSHNYYNGAYYGNYGTSFNTDLTSSPLNYGTSTTSRRRKIPFNGSNNISTNAAGKYFYRSPYLDPRYIISNHGKLPPEFEAADDTYTDVDSEAEVYGYGYDPGYTYSGFNQGYPDYSYPNHTGYQYAYPRSGYPYGHGHSAYKRGFYGHRRTPVRDYPYVRSIHGGQPDPQTVHKEHYYYIASRPAGPRYIHPKLRPRRPKHSDNEDWIGGSRHTGYSRREHSAAPHSRDYYSSDDGFIPIPSRAGKSVSRHRDMAVVGQPRSRHKSLHPHIPKHKPGHRGRTHHPSKDLPKRGHTLPQYDHTLSLHTPRKHTQSAPTLIILDIAHVDPKIGYSVTSKGSKKIFRANSPRLFGKVLNGTETLWHSSVNGYPDKVVYQNLEGIQKLKVFFPPVKTIESKYKPDPDPEPESGVYPPITKAAAHIPSPGTIPGDPTEISTGVVSLHIPTTVTPTISSFPVPDGSDNAEQPQVTLSGPTVPGVGVDQPAGIPTTPQVPPPVIPEPALKPEEPAAPIPSVVQQLVTPESSISLQPTAPGVAMPQQPVVPEPPVPEQPVVSGQAVHPTLTPHVPIPSPQQTPVPIPPSGDAETPRELLITIDLNNIGSSDKVDHSFDGPKRAHILKAKAPYLIERVTRGGKPKWQAKQGRYGSKLVVTVNPQGKLQPKMFYPADALGTLTGAQAAALQTSKPSNQVVEAYSDFSDSDKEDGGNRSKVQSFQAARATPYKQMEEAKIGISPSQVSGIPSPGAQQFVSQPARTVIPSTPKKLEDSTAGGLWSDIDLDSEDEIPTPAQQTPPRPTFSISTAQAASVDVTQDAAPKVEEDDGSELVGLGPKISSRVPSAKDSNEDYGIADSDTEDSTPSDPSSAAPSVTPKPRIAPETPESPSENPATTPSTDSPGSAIPSSYSDQSPEASQSPESSTPAETIETSQPQTFAMSESKTEFESVDQNSILPQQTTLSGSDQSGDSDQSSILQPVSQYAPTTALTTSTPSDPNVQEGLGTTQDHSNQTSSQSYSESTSSEHASMPPVSVTESVLAITPDSDGSATTPEPGEQSPDLNVGENSTSTSPDFGQQPEGSSTSPEPDQTLSGPANEGSSPASTDQSSDHLVSSPSESDHTSPHQDQTSVPSSGEPSQLVDSSSSGVGNESSNAISGSQPSDSNGQQSSNDENSTLSGVSEDGSGTTPGSDGSTGYQEGSSDPYATTKAGKSDSSGHEASENGTSTPPSDGTTKKENDESEEQNGSTPEDSEQDSSGTYNEGSQPDGSGLTDQDTELSHESTDPSSGTGKKETNTNGLEVFVEGSGTPNDSNKCDKKTLSNGEEYEFKSDSKCIKVVINGAEIWNHGDHGCREHPTCVSYTNQYNVSINFIKGFITYEKSGDEWSDGLPSMDLMTNDSSQNGDGQGGGGTDPNGTSGGDGTGSDDQSGGTGTGEGNDGNQASSGGGTNGTSGYGTGTTGGTDQSSGGTPTN